MKAKKIIFGFVIAIVIIGLSTNAWANKSAASIEAPKDAAQGQEITIKVNVAHHGNSKLHYTNWVSVKVNGKEAGRWDFSSDKLPDADKFTREIKVKVDGPLAIVAESNCNLHGSAGPAQPAWLLNKGVDNMTIAGVSIILILGVINFILLMFQALSGLHLIKVPFKLHKISGLTLLVCATIHGLLAALV